MKIALQFILVFVLLPFGMYSQTEQQKIIDVFKDYKSAILNDRGTEALKLIDKRTVDYYSGILIAIKQSDKEAIDQLSLMDKLMILIIRQQVSNEEILKFSGESLLLYAFDNGMVGKNGVVDVDLGKVTVSDDFAKAQLIIKGKEESLYFHFYKEKDWKLNLTSLFPISNIAIREMVEESGKEENDFILFLVEIMSKRKLKENIWNPIKNATN